MRRGNQPRQLCFFCNGSQTKDPIRTGASEYKCDYEWEAGRRMESDNRYSRKGGSPLAKGKAKH